MTLSSKGSQRVYYVNCPKCGEIVQVVNPVPDNSPQRVIASDEVFVDYEIQHDELVFTVCTDCKESLAVTFVYNIK